MIPQKQNVKKSIASGSKPIAKAKPKVKTVQGSTTTFTPVTQGGSSKISKNKASRKAQKHRPYESFSNVKDEKWSLNNLSIKNFKSIKNISIKPNRVNIFIGEPNSGKSNILEAISLLGLSVDSQSKTTLPSNIRFSDIVSLYYDKSYNHPIQINSSLEIVSITRDENQYILKQISIDKNIEHINLLTFTNDGDMVNGRVRTASNIRKYHFKQILKDESYPYSDILKIDGSNLAKMVRHNSKLKEFANNFFKKFSLKILFEQNSTKLDIMRTMEDSYYLIDFSMTPDTFQRILYYLAAIESNKNSVLLFEEPEAHSYPPYIQMLSERIIDDKDNQYFITTHSPFVVEKMLERAGSSDDVKIFVTYFEDYQTKVHELTKSEIEEVISNGVDLFFNMEAYQK